MISEDKVKLMTSIAILEKREGKHCFSINRYFRSDYISKHMILSLIHISPATRRFWSSASS